MSQRRITLLLAVATVVAGFAGCSAVPEGLTKEDWDSMSPAARKEVLRKETIASTPMHRALADDARELARQSSGRVWPY
jgi:hypothetical protein